MRLGLNAAVIRIARMAATLALAALVAGCFQPLYSSRPATGDPSVRDALRTIDIKQIEALPNTSEAYLAVQIRNNLLFDFNGGGNPASPRHQLIIRISGTHQAISIDQNTALPSLERYTLNASYTLTDIATKKVVLTGQTSTNVSYETLGTQRYARISGMHDAERRAAKTISDQIMTRMAAYVVSGS